MVLSKGTGKLFLKDLKVPSKGTKKLFKRE